MKVKKDTLFTIGILLLLILLFSILLFRALNRKANLGEQEIIGVVTFKEKTVQRKFDISAVWDEVENSTPVANRDTIRTMDFSDAVLTLKDNTKIKISDNSMIYLDFNEKQLKINMENGTISAERGDESEPNSTIKIQSGDKFIEMGIGATKISKGEDENLSIKVEKGAALLNVNGKEEKVETNQTAELKANRIEVKPLKFQLLSPSDSKFFSTQKDKLKVIFEWSSVENVSDLKLEIATDRNFSSNLKSFLMPRDLRKEVELLPGSYYWRIAAKNRVGGRQEYSEIRKFKIVSEKTIKITNPLDGKIFYFSSKLPIIPIGWIKNEFASSYKLEIASNPEFTNIVKTKDLFQTTVSIDLPSKGTYYARVTTRPNLPDLSPLVTPIVKFSIEEREIPLPPEPMSPVQNSSYSIEYFQKGKVNFAWRDNKEFNLYELEISKSIDFSNTILKQVSKINFLQPAFTEKTGELYYRVRGILADGRKSEFSKIVSFRISEPESLKLIFPENNSEIDMPPTKELNFKWQRPETSGEFILEISKDSNFTQIVNKIDSFKGFSKSFPIPSEGTYFWRLKLLSRDKTELTKSESNKFTILGSPSAKLLQPINESNLNLVGKEEIQFSWEKDSTAYSYEFEIIDTTKASKKSVYKATTNETSISFKDLQKFQDGKYIWGISLFYSKKDGKTAKSPPTQYSFYTQVPKVEPPIPKPILPAPNTDLVMAEKEEISFTWEKNDKAVFYQIDLHEKTAKKSKPIFQKQSSENTILYEIPIALGEGAYYYDLFIYYKTWDGKILKSSPTRVEFNLKLPLRSPPIVIMKKPINSEEIKPNDKWQVQLEWEPNPRATSYTVSVKDSSNNKILFTETTTNNTSIFDVSDAAIRPGSYKWSVALNYKSLTGKDLKAPPKVQEFLLSLPAIDVPIPVPLEPETKASFNPLDVNEIQFKWEKNNNANSFIFELYENSVEENSRPILQIETKSLNYFLKDIFKYKDGIYYWKIYATYKDRNQKIIRGEPILSEFSIATPGDEKLEPPEILNNPRLYVE